ncbi:hypothetical protein SprV_0501758200 [Sparganum proliferum]
MNQYKRTELAISLTLAVISIVEVSSSSTNMEFFKGIYLTLVLVCTVGADYYLKPGDNRTVIGNVDAPFSTTTTLPGDYDKLVSGIHSITIKNGNCSTPFFKCSMVKNSDTMSTVSISGYMSYGLKWITFSSSQNLIPISLVFLTNGVWNDLATGSIQPQYSFPLVVRAKGKHTVTITCSILTNGLTVPQRKLTIGRSNIVFYNQGGWNPVNNISAYPQIMNLEDRMVLFHRVMTLTVKQTEAIDFYACNTNKYWLTHTIDWTSAGPGRHRRPCFYQFRLKFVLKLPFLWSSKKPHLSVAFGPSGGIVGGVGS